MPTIKIYTYAVYIRYIDCIIEGLFGESSEELSSGNRKQILSVGLSAAMEENIPNCKLLRQVFGSIPLGDIWDNCLESKLCKGVHRWFPLALTVV